jgi:hypothetical protein
MSTNPTRLTTLMAAAALASAAFIAAAPAGACPAFDDSASARAEPAVQQVIVTAKRLPKAEQPLPVQRVIVTAKRLPRSVAGAHGGAGAPRPTAAPARW